MRRAAFLGGAIAATIAPTALRAQPLIAVADLCARIPGVTGLVARMMDGSPPIAQLHAQEQFPSASVIKLADHDDGLPRVRRRGQPRRTRRFAPAPPT